MIKFSARLSAGLDLFADLNNSEVSLRRALQVTDKTPDEQIKAGLEEKVVSTAPRTVRPPQSAQPARRQRAGTQRHRGKRRAPRRRLPREPFLIILRRFIKRVLLVFGMFPGLLYALFLLGREIMILASWLSVQLGLSSGGRELALWAIALTALGFSLQLSLYLVLRLWPRRRLPESAPAEGSR